MTGDPRPATTASDLPRSHSFLTDDSNGSTLAALSENSPLLGSGATSPTLRSASPGAGGHRPRGDGDDGDDGAPQHRVTTARAASISLSMWVLLFIQACNMSGMTMIQGHIAEDLDAYDSAMWFTSTYLIVMASTSPLAGRLVTIFSLRSMVLVSALLFAAGALVTSRAHSFAVFVAGRALTGLGGGCVMTLALILVLQLSSRKRRGLLLGIVNAGFTVGVSAGALVFGALLPVLGWRWLFLAQAPVGLLSGLAVYFSVPTFAATTAASAPSKDKTTLQKLKAIDYAGAASLIAAIVLFLYGLSGTIQPLVLLLSLCVLAFFVLNEYRLAADPLIPISVLESRGVLLSCLAQLGLMSARWTVLFYAPVFVLAVRGLPPTVAGAVLVPTNLGFALGGILAGGLHVRRAGSFWLPCVAAAACFALSLAALALASTAAAPAPLYVIVVLANGLATGAALTYTLAHLLHVADRGAHYVATGLLATFRGFAGSFGTSIGGGVFARALRARLAAGFAALDGGGSGGGNGLSPARAALVTRLVGNPNLVFSGAGGLSEAERAVAVAGYEAALRVLYTSALAVAVVVVFVQAGSGWKAPAAAPGAGGRQQQVDEELIREEIAEADGTMEA